MVCDNDVATQLTANGKALGMDYQMLVKRFIAIGRYVFDLLALYFVYPSTCSLLFFVLVLLIWCRSGFK